MPTTVYDVSTRYAMEVKGAGEVKRLGQTAEHTGGQLKELAKVLLVGEGFKLAKDHLIEFNSAMEALEIKSSAKIFGFGLALDIDQARIKARGLVDEYKRFEVTAPVTMREIDTFSSGIDTAVASAGGNLRDIVKVAEGGIIAAKSLGAESNYAALELTEGIQVGVMARQRFLKQLLALGHVEEGMFNRADEAGRLKMLEKVFSSPALAQAAKDFGASWVGVTSTLTSKIEQTAGVIGEGLFHGITGTLQDTNSWLAANEDRVKAWAVDMGEGLTRGFNMAKDAAGFVVDHYAELKTLAELWLAVQGVGMVGSAGGAIAGLLGKGAGLVGGAAGMLGGRGLAMAAPLLAETAALGTAATTGAVAVGSLVAPIGLAVAGLGAFWLALKAGDAMDGSSASKTRELDDARRMLASDTTTDQTGKVFDYLLSKGLLQTTGAEDSQGVDLKAFDEHLIALGDLSSEERKKLVTMADRIIDVMDPEDWAKRLGREMYGPQPKPAGWMPRNNGKGGTTVHIARVEVASEDPDRFVHHLTDLAHRAARNPQSARGAIAGRF